MQFFSAVEINLNVYTNPSGFPPAPLFFPYTPNIFLSFDLVLNFHLALVRAH